MKVLVEAAAMGDAAQLDRLIESVWPTAYRVAFAVLGERGEAEDAAQEACVILCRSISSLRSQDAFRVWFYRIVVREAAAIKRRRGRALTQPAAQYVLSDQAASMDIWSALRSLPHNLREVVVLRYFEDLNSSEIAEALNVPAGTVRFRLMRAKRRLRPLLDDATLPINEVNSHAIGL